MQRLMKAAREGTKDGLQKTRAAVRRGRSLIRTRSFLAAGGEPRAGQGDGLRDPRGGWLWVRCVPEPDDLSHPSCEAEDGTELVALTLGVVVRRWERLTHPAHLTPWPWD